MKVSFVTPTRMSLINLTTIGDSEKREDSTKIGQFSSGQAYATALLLRNNVDLKVVITGGWDEGKLEKFTEYISYGTLDKKCESTGKSKEIIELNYEKAYHGNIDSSMTFSDPSSSEFQEIETAFALQLGYNWELYMALRELWSNMLDEQGYLVEGSVDLGEDPGTVITLEFDEQNPFYEVWQNRHLYINEKQPLFKVSDKVEVLDNPENYLRIYKQNILVYSDEKVASRFAYNVKLGQIDERRILSNIYNVESEIISAIKYTRNEEFLRSIITADFKLQEKEFLNQATYGTASDLIHDIAIEVFEEFGEVKSYDWIINSIEKREDCKIGGKVIRSISDSVWTYSSDVKVETKPEVISEPNTAVDLRGNSYDSHFSAEIKKYYNFNLDCEVKQAKLKGSKVIADKFEKCLIVDYDFNLQEDFATFIIEYVDLMYQGNAVKNLGEYIVKLLKK